MGILSRLISRFTGDDTEYDEEWGEEYEDAQDTLSNLHEGMTLDILTREGDLLLTGKLTSLTTDAMKIERLPGWLSFDTLDAGETVSIRGYNIKMEQFRLSAVIEESTRIVCRLKDMKPEEVSNQRLSFRLTLNIPAELYRRDDESCLNPEECMLIDISTGGACIESEFIHEENDILYLKAKLEEYEPMKFLGQIIRASEHGDGRYQYGILFAQLPDAELTALTRTLYNIQLGNKKTWARTKQGHW